MTDQGKFRVLRGKAAEEALDFAKAMDVLAPDPIDAFLASPEVEQALAEALDVPLGLLTPEHVLEALRNAREPR